jgi:hypothetical protein
MILPETLAEIRARLASRAEEVARILLPGGKRMGKKWKCGNVSGAPGSSLEVELEGDKAGIWNDSAAGSGGDLLRLWQEVKGLDFRAAVHDAAEFVRVPVQETDKRRKAPIPRDEYHYFDPEPEPTPPPAPKRRKRSEAEQSGPAIDWDAAVAAVKPADLYQLTGWRGFSHEFAEWLKSAQLIGKIGGQWAIPVHDDTGNVVRAHVRTDNGWTYTPGSVNTPLIVGNPAKANTTLVFESQWDAFAVLDRLGHHESPGYYSAIVTRGASSNTDLAEILKGAPLVIALPQNDPPEKKNKEGRTPAEDWLHRVKKSLPESLDFRTAATPKEFKDLNDWILHANPDRRAVEETCITHARSPDIRPFLTIRQLLDYPTDDDPNCLLGKRYICRGGSLVLVGPSGAGKSTLMASMALHWSVGLTWCGLGPLPRRLKDEPEAYEPPKPLRQLIIQAENDDGDIAEMVAGSLAAVRGEWNREQYILANDNIRFCKITSETGENFCKTLERQIRFHKADIVWVDPLLSFVGGDISKQDVASEFLREHLNPVLERTGAAIIFLHHTGKPSTDSKSRSGWSNNDFAYLGFGSSEITNWARAVIILSETKDQEHKTYKMIFAKRGSRAKAKNMQGVPTDTIFIRQAGQGKPMAWTQCEELVVDEEPPKKGRSAITDDIRPMLQLIEWPSRWMDAANALAAHDLGPKTLAAAKTLLGRAIKHRIITLQEKGYYALTEH